MKESSWITAPKERLAQAVTDEFFAIQENQRWLERSFRDWATLYKGSTVRGFIPGEYSVHIEDYLRVDIDPYNIVRSAVDAIVSKITLTKPRPRFLTSGATEVVQEQAKLAEKYVAGVFEDQGMSVKSVYQVRDACIYGLGVLKIFASAEKIHIENVHPSRILVDNEGALNGCPKQMFQFDYIDRNVLLGLHPNKKQVISDTPPLSISSSRLVRDLIQVFEAWSLPTEKEPGRHVICTERGVLYEGKWERETFPFMFLRFTEDLMGFYGTGVAEILAGKQLFINELNETIRLNQRLHAVPYLLVPASAQIPEEYLSDNSPAKVITYTGPNAPQLVLPPAVNPQTLQILENTIKSAYEEIGISQMSATSKKEPGLNAAVAIRTVLSNEVQRFGPFLRRFEQSFVDAARVIIELIPELDPEGSVGFTGKDQFEKLSNGDLNMKESQYNFSVYPSSSLPTDPAGRLERVIEMLNSEMIDPREGRQLLEFPDLEKSDRLATASRDDLESLFEHMLTTGNYIKPIIYQDLETGIDLAKSYWLRGKVDGVSDNRLDMLERWMAEADEMLPRPPPPGPTGPPMLPMPPPGPPGPPMPPPGPPGPPMPPMPLPLGPGVE